MREEFVCAKCGQKLDEQEGAFVLQDNFLIAKYFDDYKSNRFCSPLCAAEALFGEYVLFNELPHQRVPIIRLKDTTTSTYGRIVVGSENADDTVESGRGRSNGTYKREKTNNKEIS